MSFDLIETTVANAIFLRASQDQRPADIHVNPLEDLKTYEVSLRSGLTLSSLLQSPLGRHQFKVYLRKRNAHMRVDLVEQIREYHTRTGELGHKKANYIFSSILLRAVAELPAFAEPFVRFREPAKSVVDNKTTGVKPLHGSSPLQDRLTSRRSRPNTHLVDSSEEYIEGVLYDLGVEQETIISRFTEWLEKRMKKNEIPPEFFDDILFKVEAVLVDSEFPKFCFSPEYGVFMQLRYYCENTPVSLDSFSVYRVLGKGAFGAVSAVRKKDTKKLYAMKEMDKRKVKYYNSERMCITEKEVLERVTSCYATKLKYAFHDDSKLFLVMDIAQGGDLQFHLSDCSPYRFEESRVKFYCAELLLALENLHSLGYVYRDLKPGNVLLDEDGHVMLADFGLVHRLNPNRVLTSLAGTAGYWAPEVMAREPQSFSIDYWSFGVFVYKLLTGTRPKCFCHKKSKEWCPFGTDEKHEKLAKAKNPMKWKLELDEEILSPDSLDLVRKLLNPNPSTRLGSRGADSIKEHHWFQSISWEKLEKRESRPPYKPRKGEVNAATLGEIGDNDANDGKYRDLEINTEQDIAFYERFMSKSAKGFEEEMVWTLQRNEANKEAAVTKELERIEADRVERGCCLIM